MSSIDQIIAELADWRGDMLAHIRDSTNPAEPVMVEETKWKKPQNPLGLPLWSLDGVIETGEIYKGTVKLTFAKGASLDEPDELFNGSLRYCRVTFIGEICRIEAASLSSMFAATAGESSPQQRDSMRTRSLNGYASRLI